MARNSETVSRYYPPRQRWHGRFFYWGLAIRHRLALDRIQLPEKITIGGIIPGILIPGLAVYIRGPRLWGKLALSACAFLFLSFFVWLGYPAGNDAFGLLISMHVTGLVYYFSPALRNEDFWHRLLLTIAVLLGLGLFFYAPLRGTIENRWAMPLRANGHVIVVQRNASARGIKRGDWMAYTLSGQLLSNHGYEFIYHRNGMALGPVLAASGDRVEFSAKTFSVNGTPHSRLSHMPASGSLVVPENHWFIWPNLDISGNWNVGEANISSVMLQMANVSEGQFVGRPFQRWFWRKQILP